MNDLLQPGRHPDADQLSAFAEHVLPAHEQQQTLAHLAVCADCRALVYLAQAAEPVEPPPQAQPVRVAWFSGWSSWNLAWPAAAALGCMILVSLHLRHTATQPSAVSTPTIAAAEPKQAQEKAQEPNVPLREASTSEAKFAHPHKKPSSATSGDRDVAATRSSIQPTTVPGQTNGLATGGAVGANAVAGPLSVASALPAAATGASLGMRTVNRAPFGEGEISGTVTDKTGAVVPHAQITATNTETGVQTTRESTGTGQYSIAPLPPGNYNVEVVAKGFQRLLQENVQVNPTELAGLNMKLTVGGESTTVTITDAPPYLDTASARLGGTIENEMYTNLPLAMNAGPRDPTQFQYLMPGVQEGPPPASSGGLNQGIYGGSGQQNLNENYIEGMPVSNIKAQGDNSPVAKAVAADAGPQLPSHLPALSTIGNGHLTLAFDAAGALFRSDDAGVTWRPVSAQWQGKVKALQLAVAGHSAPAPVYPRELPDNVSPPVTAATVAQPVFELTTDGGVVYTSADGQSWTRR